MRDLFESHWINHDDLLKRVAANPQQYLALAYWAGRTPDDIPVFFITAGNEPTLDKDPRFLGLTVRCWQRLSTPSEAEGILTERLDQNRGPILVPVDVHWSIQFSETNT